MMRDTITLGERGLGSADVQMTENLERIVIDDLAGKRFGQKEGQVGLTACCRTDDRNQWIHNGGPKLIDFLDVDSFVVFLQDLLIRRAVQRHAVRANLAHADAMAPTPPE